MLNLELLQSDLNYILTDIPVTVTINSVEYTATKGMLTNNQIYTDFGLGDEYAFSVYISIDVLPSVPENHTLLTISGVEYRILFKEIDSADQLLILHLGNKYGKTN